MKRQITFLFASMIFFGAPAAAGQTVAVAPLSSASTAEYQWIGSAIAGALSLRVHEQPALNAVTLRQVNSAMRQDNIQRDNLNQDEVAFRLGRQIGADLLMVGSYEAAWPEIELLFKVIDPQKGTVQSSHVVTGDLDELIDLEARMATELARGLELDTTATKTFGALPGFFGTTSLKAWRHTTLALEVINWQSLSPRAADPSAPLNLPTSSLNTAEQHLMAATRFDANYGEAWSALGVTQALKGDNAAAWRSFGKAIALGQGQNPTAVLGAAFLRMREARHDDAATILVRAVKRHVGFLHARGYLGELYNHLGRHREALPVFEAYHELTPRNPWVLAQLGYTKARLKDHIGAIADTIAAVDMLPESPALLTQLASRYIDANKLAGAEDALQHALRLFPEEARIYVRLGYVYLRQDKLELAIPISEKGLSLAQFADRRRDRGYAHLNLARAYGRQGDLDTAFAHLADARNNGITSFEEVARDPQLQALRADSRYRMAGY